MSSHAHAEGAPAVGAGAAKAAGAAGIVLMTPAARRPARLVRLLPEHPNDAIANGPDTVGVAGGDGTQAIVAAIAAEHGLPYVCVPAGDP